MKTGCQLQQQMASTTSANATTESSEEASPGQSTGNGAIVNSTNTNGNGGNAVNESNGKPYKNYDNLKVCLNYLFILNRVIVILEHKNFGTVWILHLFS